MAEAVIGPALINDDPMLMEPKFEVMAPPSKLPTEVMLVCPGVVNVPFKRVAVNSPVFGR